MVFPTLTSLPSDAERMQAVCRYRRIERSNSTLMKALIEAVKRKENYLYETPAEIENGMRPWQLQAFMYDICGFYMQTYSRTSKMESLEFAELYNKNRINRQGEGNRHPFIETMAEHLAQSLGIKYERKTERKC